MPAAKGSEHVRTCYQVHTHRAPEQVYRLVETLVASSRDALVVVSHDRSGPPLDRSRLARSGARLLVSTGGYADFSHTRRYLEVVEHLDGVGEQYDWMVNLSGQDYPVQPLADIEHEMERSGVDGFLETFPVLSAASPWGRALGRTRYWYRYGPRRPLSAAGRRRLRPLQAVNRVQPWLRLHVASGLTVGRAVRTPFDSGLVCYGGSFFASLTRSCVEALVEFCRDRPDVVAHFERTLSPEEAFFQTALVNDGRFRFDSDCKRYFDFRGSRFGHPRTLTAADVEPALRRGAHFARKWDLDRDPDAYELMDALVLPPGG